MATVMKEEIQPEILNFSLTQPWDVKKVQSLPARTLAYIGDSVFELGNRLRHVAHAADAVGRLHSSVVKRVCASNQAKLFDMVWQNADEYERELLKHWRNAKMPYRGPKHDRSTYAYATAFEAWVGFLFLTAQNERLEKLFGMAADGGNL